MQQQGHNVKSLVEEFGELVTVDEVDDRLVPGEFTFREGAKPVKLLVRANIVTVDFIEKMAKQEGAQQSAEAARAIAGANRLTRRVTKSKRAQKKEPELKAVTAAPSKLEAQKEQMRFMAGALEKAIGRWNMAVPGPEGKPVPVAPTADYFCNHFNFELLTEFFEYVIFEVAAPKKTDGPTAPLTSETSADTSSTADES